MKYPRMTQIFQDAVWKNKTPGFYVEIGAHDGKKKNSTVILENAGWDGVCVEPTPESFHKLEKNRKCRCENVAVWRSRGTEAFAVYPNDLAFSGIAESLDKDHIARINETVCIEVKTCTWQDLNLPLHIDYLQLDVEGAEMQVLDCIDWKTQSISYICLEDNSAVEGSPAYYDYMLYLGYECVCRQHVDFLWMKV